MKQAVVWRMLSITPCDGIALPRGKRHEITVLDRDQARCALRLANSTRYGALFAFALETGMRPSEYTALQWPDLNLDKRTVSVNRSIAWVGQQWTLNNPKTAKARRTIDLSNHLVELLRGHKAEQATEHMKLGLGKPAFVFTDQLGGPIERNNLRRRWKGVAKRLGRELKDESLPKIRLYDLRHSSISHALMQGVPPHVVSRRAGHASVAFTLDCYAHLLPGQAADATERLARVLYGD